MSMPESLFIIMSALCEFCQIIKKRLDSNLPIAEELIGYKAIFKVREAHAIGRGFNLCDVHIKTIKKDNKIRIAKGQDIPNSLDVIKKMLRSDI